MTVLIYNSKSAVYQSPDICKAISGLFILPQYHIGLINNITKGETLTFSSGNLLTLNSPPVPNCLGDFYSYFSI